MNAWRQKRTEGVRFQNSLQPEWNEHICHPSSLGPAEEGQMEVQGQPKL